MVNLLENDEEDILSQPDNEGPGDTLTPKPENDFAARLEAMVQQLDQQATDLNKFRTKQSVSFAGDVPNPDDHAVDVENADKTNLPVEVAQAQRPAFDAAALDAQVEKMNPGYLKWLADRDNAAISKDDTSTLERISALWDATKGAYKTGNAITDVGLLGFKNLTGDITDAELLELKARERDLERLQQQQKLSGFGGDTALEQLLAPSGFILSSVESLPMLIQTQTGSLDEAMQGGLIGGTAGFAFGGVGAVPGFFGGIGAGWRVGMGLEAGKLEAGLAFQEYITMKDDNGQLLDRDLARTAALLTGAVNGGLEVFAMKTLLKAAPGGEQFLRMVSREGMKEALKRPTFRRALTNYSKRVAMAGGAEGVTEFLQETMTTVAGSVAKALQQGRVGELATGEFWAKTFGESAYAGVRGMQGGAGTATVLGAPTVALDVNRARNAERDKLWFDELAAGATESKTRQRSPGRFADFIREQAAGSNVETVYVDANRFVEMFQGMGFDADEVAENFDLDPAEIDAAREAGTDIGIDVGTFAAKIAPNEALYKGVEADLRITPDSMTMREAVKFKEEIQANVDDEVERIVLENEGASETEIIYNQIFGQLRNAGQGPDAADAVAQNVVSAVVSQAEMDGITPLELWVQYPLDIERVLPEQLEVKQGVSTAQEVIMERARTGRRRTERQLFGRSLIDFVRDRGVRYDPDAVDTPTQLSIEGGRLNVEGGPANLGADPMIGDLQGMDIDKDLRPGERRALRPEGMTLDDLALAAQEAGYFPERLLEQGDRIDINDLVEAIRENLAGNFTYIPEAENIQDRDLDAAADELVDALNSIGLDPTEMTLDEIREVIDRERSKAVGDGGIELQHSAYHGTGASELEGGRFDISRVGDPTVGEGHTAYGWGLYFASERGVAEHYRAQNAPNTVKIKIKDFDIGDGTFFSTDTMAPGYVFLNDQFAQQFEWFAAHSESFDVAVSGLKEWAQQRIDNPYYEGRRDKIERDLRLLDQLTEDDVTVEKGSLYRVELQPDIDEYLDWDIPVNEQSQDIQDKLRRMLNPSEHVYFDLDIHSETYGQYVDISVEDDISIWEKSKLKYQDIAAAKDDRELVKLLREIGDSEEEIAKRLAQKKEVRDFDDPRSDYYRLQVYNRKKLMADANVDAMMRAPTGGFFYRNLSGALSGGRSVVGRGDQATSMMLRDAGLPGNRFLDAQHRGWSDQLFGPGRQLMFKGEPVPSHVAKLIAEQSETAAFFDTTQPDQPLTQSLPADTVKVVLDDQILERWRRRLELEQQPPAEELGPMATASNEMLARFDAQRDEAIEILSEMAAEPDQVKIEKTGEGYNFVLYDDSLVDVTGKQGIDFFQSSVPLQRRPLKIEGTGPGGRVTNWDFAEALTDRHMEKHGRVLDPSAPQDMKLIVREGNREFINQARQDDTGEAWYTEDIASAMETTAAYIPALQESHPDAELYQELFLVMTALMSPQEKPPQNWEKASLAFEGYIPDGLIPDKKPNGKGWGVNALAFPLLQHMMDTMGLKETLVWLREPHTGREIAEMRRASGIFKGGDKSQSLAQYKAAETTLGETYLGIYMFGPKVGDFMMNSTGHDLEAVTVDLWLARSYNRHIGRLLDVGPKLKADRKIISEVRTPSERKLIKAWVRELAEKNGMTASAMQAALWYYEQRLFRNHGIQSESTNFNGSAVLAAERRGVTVPGRSGDVSGTLQAEGAEQSAASGPTLFQSGIPAEGVTPFYSAVTRAADDLAIEKGTGEQFLAAIKKTAGVRDEEISWIGLDEFLAGRKGVTRQEVQDYVRENQLVIEEVVKAGRLVQTAEGLGDRQMPVYGSSDFNLPGGTNYREVLLKLPVQDAERISGYVVPTNDVMADDILTGMSFEGLEDLDYGRAVDRRGDDIIEFNDLSRGSYNQVKQIVEAAGGRLREAGRSGKTETFVGSHFPTEENVLAWVRVNDRIGPNGEKILFIEEIQSDWHQRGRKHGYDKGGVPDAPFKNTWHEMSFRRVVEMAAREGYDQVSWTPGEVQADRYDLSKQVDSIRVEKLRDGDKAGQYYVTAEKDGRGAGIAEVVTEDKLAGVIGKELAEKAIADAPDNPDGKDYTGLDLKIGGKGMKKFYDQMVKNYASKFAKKFGSKVTTTEIELPESVEQGRNIDFDELEADAIEFLKEQGWRLEEDPDGVTLLFDPSGNSVGEDPGGGEIIDFAESQGWVDPSEAQFRATLIEASKKEVWTMPVTDQMRASVGQQGVPLFQGGQARDLLTEQDKQAAVDQANRFSDLAVSFDAETTLENELEFRGLMVEYDRQKDFIFLNDLESRGVDLSQISENQTIPVTAVQDWSNVVRQDGSAVDINIEDFRSSVFSENDFELWVSDTEEGGFATLQLKNWNEINERLEAETAADQRIETIEDALNHPSHMARAAAFGSILNSLGIEYSEAGSEFASRYFYVEMPAEVFGDIKVRFADHMRQSRLHGEADFNIADGGFDTAMDALDAIVKSYNQAEVFQPRRGDGPRGSFTPGANFGEGGRSTIRLFENADLTTTLHELSHFYLEMMRDRAKRPMAAEQLKRDWSTLEDWWAKNPDLIAEKANKEAQGRGMDIEVTSEQAAAYSANGTTGNADLDMILFVAQHEVTADAHEIYLMEGKSPSLKLAEAFERFSAWMIRVYGAVTKLGVNPPQEVKEVFDRWLATEAEIKQAEEFSSAAAVFETFEEFDGTEAEYEEYKAAETRAHAQAKQKLMKRKMRDIERQQTAEGQAVKDEVYAQVENEINQMPVYRVWEWLARGRVLAGEDVPEFLESGKRLSKTWLVNNFGDDIVSILPKGGNRIHQRDLPGNEGLNPDVVAEAFGFKSVDEMIDAILAAPNRKQYLAQEQEARLRDDPRWQGDTVQSGNIEQAAIEDVHNDERGTFLHLELQAINKKGELGEPSARQVAKETARRILGRIKVGAAITPGKYRAAEARYAKEAQEAVAAGDFQAASAAKYQQLLNHYLYSESLKVREDMDKAVKYVRKFSGPAKRLRNIDFDYVERIQQILSAFQFSARLSDKKREKLQAQALEEWAKKKNEDEGAEILIPQEILDADEKTHYRDIPVSEFRALIDTIKNLEAQGRLATKITLAGEKLELDNFASEVNDSIFDNWKGGFRNINEPPTERQGKVSSLKRKFGLRKMEFVMRRLDGFKTGPMTKIFRMIADADDAFAERRAEAATKFREIWGVYGPLELRQMANKKIFIREINTSLTKDAILAVAFNVGNEDNRAKLMEGYGWNDTQVDAILRYLDERDWEVVQAVFDHLDSYWAETVQLDTERRGYPASKVEAQPIVLDGVERAKGGYYPLKWDYLADGRNRDDLMEPYDLLKMGSQSMSSHPSTSTGRTIERQASAGGRKVRLEGLNVYLKAVDDTIHDLSWRGTVKDVTKIMNHKDVRTALLQTMGRDFMQQFNDWFSDSVVGDMNDPRTADEIFRILRGRISVATMGWKVSTALVQPLGYFSTMSRFVQDYGIARGGYYSLKGIKDFYGNPARMKERIDFVMERSPMMRERSKTFDRDVYDNLKRLRKGRYGEVEASFFWLTSKLQLAVDMPTWMGAYEAAQANDPSMTEEQAAKEADSVVRMTQSSGAAKDLTNFQRGGEGKKLFSFYMTFFSAMTNMMEDQFVMAKQNRKYVPRAIASLFLLTFMPVVMEEGIKSILGVGGPDEDDEEGWGEYLAKKWASFSIGGIPVVRDIANVMLTDFDYTFSPAARVPEMIIKAGTQVKEVVWDEDGITFDSEEIDRKLAKSLVDAASIVIPLPASQMKLTGEYFYDYWEGEQEPDNWANFLAEAFYRKDPKDYQ